MDSKKQGRDPQESSGVFYQHLSCSAQGHTIPAALSTLPMVTATRSPLLLPPKTSYRFCAALLHRTTQFSNTVATTLKSALYLLCLVREQGQGGTACPGDTREPLMWVCLEHHRSPSGTTPLHTSAQTRLSSITESVYGQNCFISFRGLGPSSPVKPSSSDTPQQAAGLLEPFSGASCKCCAEDMKEVLRVCLPNHPPLGQEGRLTLSFPSKGKCTEWSPKRKKFFNIKSLIKLVSKPEVSFLQHNQVLITEFRDLHLCYTAAFYQFNGECQVFCRVWSFGPEAVHMLKASEVFCCLR